LPVYPGYNYHDPQFTWMKTVAPTGIAFVNSPQFEKYKNSVFVGDCNNGNLYRFELNDNRDGFIFKSPQLTDKVVDIGESMDEIMFGIPANFANISFDAPFFFWATTEKTKFGTTHTAEFF